MNRPRSRRPTFRKAFAMTTTISTRLAAAAFAAVLALGAWLPTVSVPASAQFAAAPVAVELA